MIMNWRWNMTKKADFYDSYEEVFVSPKDKLKVLLSSLIPVTTFPSVCILSIL